MRTDPSAFTDEVSRLIELGRNRPAATIAAAKRFPEAHAAWLLATNEDAEDYVRAGQSAGQRKGFAKMAQLDNFFIVGCTKCSGEKVAKNEAYEAFERRLTTTEKLAGATPPADVPQWIACPECNGLGVKLSPDIARMRQAFAMLDEYEKRTGVPLFPQYPLPKSNPTLRHIVPGNKP